MKKIICIAASLVALNLAPVFSQPNMPLSPGAQVLLDQARQSAKHLNQPSALTKFNLDFPGGTPAELVKAIEKAMGKPLNVIIPDEDANFKLPPLKLHDVTFPQLAETMRVGSLQRAFVQTGTMGTAAEGYYTTTLYDFTTVDNSPTDNSVWFFHVQRAPAKPPIQRVCRFYSLAPYLDRGFTVDDITTAIQTGWKMAGITSPPELDYHKETRLLIAFGEPNELQTIQDVLSTLPQYKASLSALWRANQNLQNQVDELKRELSATNSIPAAAPEKNSGKYIPSGR